MNLNAKPETQEISLKESLIYWALLSLFWN
jgi:hypothetical protein